MDDYRQLVLRAQSNIVYEQRIAFDELVQRFYGMAFQQALNMLDDVHLAEDAVQEAFLSAYLRIGQLREVEAFPMWLRRIVQTHADRLVRGKKVAIVSLDTQDEIAWELPTPETMVEDQEFHARVYRALDALPEHERAVTEGFYIQGESQQELADRLQLPLTTVKKRLQYARQHLRLLVGDLNAAFDQAVASMLNPPKPKPQPVYLYNPIPDEQE